MRASAGALRSRGDGAFPSRATAERDRVNRPEPPPKKATRIQKKNRKAILQAALEVFSQRGFRGSTIDRIAERAGLSKPNLLYYYPSKEAIYVAVLEDTLDVLAGAARRARSRRAIRSRRSAATSPPKLEMSRTRPEASRLFANEILHGAPAIGDFLAGPLKTLVDEKAAVIAKWIAEGRLRPVEPRHLIMMIWAVTQHYADFDVQVQAVLGDDAAPDAPLRRRRGDLMATLFEGLRPR